MSEEYTGTITCRTFVDLNQMLLHSEGACPTEYNEQLTMFMNLVATLPHGCNCTKDQRGQASKAMYLQMAFILTEQDRRDMKEFYKVGKIIFKDEEQEFLSF